MSCALAICFRADTESAEIERREYAEGQVWGIYRHV